MKNTAKLPLVFLMMFFLLHTSCTKILEVEPVMILESENAIVTVRDLEAVLFGAYDGLQSGNLLGGNLVVYAEILGTDAFVNQSRLTPFGTQEIYNLATTVQIGALRNLWSEAYSAINRANIVIDYVDNNKLSGADFDAVKIRFKGEALFIRAIAHYEILRLWAHAYNVDNAGSNTQLGVPYRTIPTYSGNQELAMKRATVEEVYTNVLNDLNQAALLLNQANVISSEYRASEMAAKAYMARVYFFKGDYTLAGQMADDVIESNLYSLNDSVLDVYRTTGLSATGESIFQIANIENDNSNAIRGNFQRTLNPLLEADTNFYNTFDANDLRKTKLYFKNPWTGSVFVTKYDQTGTNPNNISVIRMAEMHLIRAESFVLSSGDITKATVSYDAIRQRALLPPINTVDQFFIDSIRVERRKELAFEGDNYHNLKRLKQNVRHNAVYNDNRLLFKIPQEEMSGNALMEQNP